MTKVKDEFYFIDGKIAFENIGEHDADNRFLLEDIHQQMRKWRDEHPDCTPIGVCYDERVEKCGFRPMVYEDKNGNRFYTHIDIPTIKEYIELEEKEND